MPTASADPARRGRRRFPAGALAAAAALLALVLPVPYILEGPGPAIDVLGEHEGRPVLEVQGGVRDPGEGTLDMTTVLVSGPPTSTTSALELFGALLDPSRDAVPRELVYPTGMSADQVDTSNAAAMTDSQKVAAAAALRELGRPVPSRLVVGSLTPEAPSAGVLHEGDVILRAGDREATDVEAVRAAVDAAGPDPVHLLVRREGRQIPLEVPVAAAPEGSERAWQMGALLGQDFDLPTQVTVTLADVGGPSAGMMFSLAVIERLTPGAMTGGERIAGTGTVDADGHVGPIGGIAQKVQGAADAGARVFLAPAENCAELAGRVPEGITVYAVDTLHTARGVVEAVGRDESPQGVPTCG
ncbi:PDZ domain-containing protein [Micrococcus sp.]|uniref:YlbL family protein n=1 Tax=Micrococcus sp. TaxID=1271 RepID=UPI002A91B8A5|nr:S16 family serine protease [Micrococcus sp.]MDY6055152.1 S16 family serine protease [Micrococcus sp.]